MNRSHRLWSMINHHCPSAVIIKLGIPKLFFKTKHKWNCIQSLLDVRIFAYVDCLFRVNTIFLLCCVTLCYHMIFRSIRKSAPFSMFFSSYANFFLETVQLPWKRRTSRFAVYYVHKFLLSQIRFHIICIVTFQISPTHCEISWHDFRSALERSYIFRLRTFT